MKIILALALVVGCSSRSPQQASRITCNPSIGTGESNDCRLALVRFFDENRNVRVRDVSAVYDTAVPSTDLIIWTGGDSTVARAKDLKVANFECAPADGRPDCTTMIGGTLQTVHDRHVAIVPLDSKRGDGSGSWSFLDVTSSAEVSTKTSLVEVPCHLDAGEPRYADQGQGVIRARLIGSLHAALDSPSLCEASLVNYLRAHPEEGIIAIYPQDRFIDGSLFPGTASLLVVTGSSGTLSKELAVQQLACADDVDCVATMIELRTASNFARGFVTVPIAETLAGKTTRVSTLLIVGKAN